MQGDPYTQGAYPTRRPSTAEERKSLIDKYKQDINQTEIDYYDSVKKDARQEDQVPQSYEIQQKEGCWDKMPKGRKTFLVVTIVVVVLLAITLPIVISVAKSGGGSNGRSSQNPYQLIRSHQRQFGKQSFLLKRDQGMNARQSVAVTQDNKFIDNITIDATLINYKTARIQIRETNATQDTYEVPESFLQEDYLSDFEKGLSNDKLKLDVSFMPTGDHQFYVNLLNGNNNDSCIICTGDQDFLAMTHYMNFGFVANAINVFGLSDQSDSFNLTDGDYNLFPYATKGSTTTPGQGGQIQSQHPFLMFQQNNSDFVGVYLFNSNAQQFKIKNLKDKQQVQVSIIALGGMIDLFVFNGPTYQKVLQQYHNIIGKPKLLPIWAHGFHTRSQQYISNENIYEAIANYTKNQIMPESVGLPQAVLNNYENFNFNLDTAEILKKYNNDLHLVLPFTYFIPNDQNTANITKNLQDGNHAVGIFEKPMFFRDLRVFMHDIQGYCIDFFQEDIGDFLKENYKSELDMHNTALWLDSNTPYFTSFDVDQYGNSDNPFQSIPFIPGSDQRGPLNKNTLPMNAVHCTTSKCQINWSKQNAKYHFNLHGLFGTRMSNVMAQVLPETSTNFIITDSTFPGAGSQSIAHLIPNKLRDWSQLKKQLTSMLNFNMFGIPYVSPDLCNMEEVNFDAELCARSFQLSVVSPIAIKADISRSLFDDTTKVLTSSIATSLKIRNMLLIYQRTELYKLQENGGALLRPFFTDYPQDKELQQSNQTSFMYGPAIKVDFAIHKDQKKINASFPENNWLNLNTFQLLRTTDKSGKIKTELKAGIDSVNMFQKPGTIIPIQRLKPGKTMTTKELQDVPLTLSVNLHPEKNAAFGHVYLDNNEQGEFYEIKAGNNILAFKQQNSGAVKALKSKNIETLILTGTSEPVSFGCVLFNNYQTTRRLQVTHYDVVMQQAILGLSDPTYDMPIDKIAFILYSNKKEASCNPDLFMMKLDKVLLNDTNMLYLKVNQKLQTALDQSTQAYDIWLNITMLTDNSLYMFWAMSQYSPYVNAPTFIYDRNFTQFAGSELSYNISDIVYVNSDPFYIEVHQPFNRSVVLWSTKDQPQILFTEFNLFTYTQPYSNPERFYGLQERKGNFYLQPNYVYSLYNNDNNVPDSHQANGRVIQHGKNGNFPVIFSKLKYSSNVTAVVTFNPYGSDFAFLPHYQKGVAITQISPQSLVEHILIFNMTAMETTKAIAKHVKLGKISELQKTQRPNIPPHDFTFGWYASLKGLEDDEDIQSLIDMYDDWKWPFEGLILEPELLDQYQSLSFSPERFSNITKTLDYLKSKNMSHFQVLQSGFKASDQSGTSKYLKETNALVQRPSSTPQKNPLVGENQQGDIYFIDYSLTEQAASALSQWADKYNAQYKQQNFGIVSTNNEFTSMYCSGDCFQDTHDDFDEGLHYKVGTTKQLKNSLAPQSQRALGRESRLHNLNGLMEAFAFANSENQQQFLRTPIFSQSAALGSGNILNIARVLNYIDYSTQDALYAMQTLQTLSILGMPLIGYEVSYKSIPQTGENSANSIHLRLGAMMPIFKEQLNISPRGGANGVIDYSEFTRYRLAFLRYTKTQIFKQRISGEPFIRPLFYDFPEDYFTYPEVDKQYMYGSNIKVSIHNNANKEEPAYFPAGQWCSVYFAKGSKKTQCLQSGGQSFTNLEAYVYLRPGSITFIQDPYDQYTSMGTGMRNTRDMENIYLDIHINLDENGEATGELFMDRNLDYHNEINYQMSYFTLKNNNMTVTFEREAENPRDDFRFPGYTIGGVYIYSNKYDQIIFNGSTCPLQYSPENPNLRYFTFYQSKFYASEIQYIQLKPRN